MTCLTRGGGLSRPGVRMTTLTSSSTEAEAGRGMTRSR